MPTWVFDLVAVGFISLFIIIGAIHEIKEAGRKMRSLTFENKELQAEVHLLEKLLDIRYLEPEKRLKN